MRACETVPLAVPEAVSICVALGSWLRLEDCDGDDNTDEVPLSLGLDDCDDVPEPEPLSEVDGVDEPVPVTSWLDEPD